MRLIEAEELINILEWNKKQEKDALVSINSLIKLIKERPTAYDVDKVVEELDAYITKLVGKNSALYQTIIGIVKAGGIDGNTNT